MHWSGIVLLLVLGSAVLGLTLRCAQCHSHKYDPLPQRDYYRFKAIFQGALDEHDWSSFKTRSLNIATTQSRKRVAATNPPLEAAIKKIQTQQKISAGNITLGKKSAMAMMPSHVGDCVSSHVSQATAILCTHIPNCEKRLPII